MRKGRPWKSVMEVEVRTNGRQIFHTSCGKLVLLS